MKRFFENLYYPFRIFSIFALVFLSGILLSSFVDLEWSRSWPAFVLGLLLLLAVSLLGYYWRLRFYTLFSFVLIFLLIGVAYFSYFRYQEASNYPRDKQLQIIGRIIERPQVDYKDQKVILEINNKENPWLHGDKTRLSLALPHIPSFHFGEKIKLEGEVRPLTDRENYLLAKGVSGIISNPKGQIYLAKNEGLWLRLIGGLYYTSEYFENTLNNIVPEPQASLASGILLGVKRNIPEDLLNAFKDTGLTHIIALSGYNVTVIVNILAVVTVFWLGRRRSFFLGAVLVVLFVLMSGNPSSVIRAAIFSLTLLFGRTIGRMGDQTNLMLLAALVMVIANPFVLRYDAGFQLSFLAFAGLIYLSPWLKKAFERGKAAKLPEGLRLTMSETLGAQFAVLPLLYFKFGNLSLIAPLANILVLWCLPLAMALIFATGLLGIIFMPLGKLAGFLLWPVLEYIIKITEILAKLPFASIHR